MAVRYCNSYLESINAGHGALIESLDMNDYRITPKGQKIVPELIRVGTVIKTSYSTGPYTVINVTGPYTQSAMVKEWIYPPHYSLRMCLPDKFKDFLRLGKLRDSDYYYVNELVAIDNEILHLFKANEDKVIIVEQLEYEEQLNLFK